MNQTALSIAPSIQKSNWRIVKHDHYTRIVQLPEKVFVMRLTECTKGVVPSFIIPCIKERSHDPL